MRSNPTMLAQQVRATETSLMVALTEVTRKPGERRILAGRIREAVETALDAKWQREEQNWHRVKPQDGIDVAIECAQVSDASSPLALQRVRAYAVAVGRQKILLALSEVGADQPRRRGRPPRNDRFLEEAPDDDRLGRGVGGVDDEALEKLSGLFD